MNHYVVKPAKRNEFFLTNEMVVDIFLNIHNRWFVDPTNDLCGEREIARTALLTHLQDPQRDDVATLIAKLIMEGAIKPGTKPFQVFHVEYVVDKFEREFIHDYFDKV